MALPEGEKASSGATKSTLTLQETFRLHKSCVLSVPLCVYIKSADVAWAGKRETENFKWGSAVLFNTKSTLLTLPRYERQTPLTAASVALSLRSLSVIKFYDKASMSIDPFTLQFWVLGPVCFFSPWRRPGGRGSESVP